MTHASIKEQFRAAFAVILVVSLIGCSSLKPLPSDTFYRMKVEPVPAANGALATRAWTDGVIRIPKFLASGVHRERPLAYAEHNELVLKQHRFHLWIDTPERLIQNELIAFLKRIGAAKIVSDSSFGADESIEIRGRIEQLEEVLGDSSNAAVVAISFELVRHGSDKQLIFSQTYRESRTLSTRAMDEFARSISSALGAVFSRFAEDASEALRRSEATSRL